MLYIQKIDFTHIGEGRKFTTQILSPDAMVEHLADVINNATNDDDRIVKFERNRKKNEYTITTKINEPYFKAVCVETITAVDDIIDNVVVDKYHAFDDEDDED